MKNIIRKILKEEKVPQPGVSSAKGTDVSNMTPNTKYLNINEILDQIDGIPYYKEVLGDIIKNDYSWEVTKKVLEYGKHLKFHPESISELPPINVIDNKLDDGAHRISAIYLLDNLLDRNNPYWDDVQLQVDFYNSSPTEEIVIEEVSATQERHQQKMVDILTGEGFHGGTPYQEIIRFLHDTIGMEGMEAFEVFQLFKDNYRKDYESQGLKRSDITKRKIRTSNTRARDVVTNKIPFKGSNTHGEYRNGSYVVFSYDWYPIFVYKDGQWFENEQKYSVSTSKQTSQLRPLVRDIIYASKDKLWEIINRK